jgi:Lactate racemase N-terminal domain
VTRVPILTGSRLAIVDAPEDAVILRPPGPGEAIADVGAAVRDALRFPLVGEPLEALVRRGGRATVVIEPPALPIPGAQNDPRRAAIGAVVAELERAGVPMQNQTLLVAGGLARRFAERELEQFGIVSPEFARRFRGRVEIHDVEDPELVEIGRSGRVPLQVNRRLLETDLVVVVTAAETVLHGGPAALLGAGGRAALRAAGAYSLLETSASQGWQIAVSVERELSRRVPVIGASLTFNHPRLTGAVRGYPYDEQALERIAGSRLRRPFGLGHTRGAAGRDRDRSPADDPVPPA